MAETCSVSGYPKEPLFRDIRNPQIVASLVLALASLGIVTLAEGMSLFLWPTAAFVAMGIVVAARSRMGAAAFVSGMYALIVEMLSLGVAVGFGTDFRIEMKLGIFFVILFSSVWVITIREDYSADHSRRTYFVASVLLFASFYLVASMQSRGEVDNALFYEKSTGNLVTTARWLPYGLPFDDPDERFAAFERKVGVSLAAKPSDPCEASTWCLEGVETFKGEIAFGARPSTRSAYLAAKEVSTVAPIAFEKPFDTKEAAMAALRKEAASRLGLDAEKDGIFVKER